MRLEILVQDGEVQIYPLNRPKLIIGSGDVCDIVLNAEGVSRKHLFIVVEDDQYFVIDQGSTNGTFINEERLQPGKKVEFTSFFPVRLGENVLLTLLSDADSDDYHFSDFNSPKDASSPSIKAPDKAEMTRSLSMSDLTGSKTQNLVKRRKEIHNSKAQPKKTAAAPVSKDQSRMTVAKVGAVMLIAGAAYYNFFMIEKEPEQGKVAVVGEVVKVEPVDQGPSITLVPTEDLVPYENLLIQVKDVKCVNEYEKFLCNNIKDASALPWGVVQVKLMLNVFVDGTNYLTEARNNVPMPRHKTPEELEKYQKDVTETAIASFIVYGLPSTVDYDMIKDFGITIVLVSPGQDKIEAAASIGPGAIKVIKEQLQEKNLLEVRSIGIRALDFTRKLYRIY